MMELASIAPMDRSMVERHNRLTSEVEKALEEQRVKFSIIHPSARPDKWRAVYDDWIGKCVNPADVEYILCVDERWGFTKEWAGPIPPSGFTGKIVWNTGLRCYVDAVNLAAKQATGDILIVIADDQYACDGWDEKLSGATSQYPNPATSRFVAEVFTSTPDEHNRGIIVLPILSRGWYEHLGGTSSSRPTNRCTPITTFANTRGKMA